MTETLFDAEAAQVAATEAIGRAGDHAPPDWMDEATNVVRQLARRCDHIDTDLIWSVLTVRGMGEPPEPRALGAVMRHARSEGWIEPTDTYVPSARIACHGRPIRRWRSRIAVL